ncbi:MAG: LLM class F420-dependent oxidoreductase, partial [Acidimicrobiales bacterium]
GDDPIDLGTICEPLYVGEADWDVGPWTISGPAEQVAERIRELRELGVNHVQIRPRSRTRDEFCDQLAAIGRDVLPLLN